MIEAPEAAGTATGATTADMIGARHAAMSVGAVVAIVEGTSAPRTPSEDTAEPAMTGAMTGAIQSTSAPPTHLSAAAMGEPPLMGARARSLS